MKNVIVVDSSFQQRVCAQGGAKDTIVICEEDRSLILLDDEKAKNFYVEWILEDQDIAITEMVESHNDGIKRGRMKRYAAESEPLYIEWQYDSLSGAKNAEEKKQQWLDKVKEIKSDLPLIEL